MIMKRKCLLAGFGSIGMRHAELLTDMGFEVVVASTRKNNFYESFDSLEKALSEYRFDYAVICVPTSEHYGAVCELAEYGFKGPVLVEKPLFEKTGYTIPESMRIFVGYNLRFHPVMRELHELVHGRRLYSMHVYCGQYLPWWRKNRDYRKTYSASAAAGGGVLRDLSHELDYICWLSGSWKKLAAKGGHLSCLEIDSDDVFCILMETENCPAVTLQVNYLDRNVRREILVNGENFSARADLIAGVLEVNGKEQIHNIRKNFTYIEQHKDILSGSACIACTVKQGSEVLELIDAAEKASSKRIWVKRN